MVGVIHQPRAVDAMRDVSAFSTQLIPREWLQPAESLSMMHVRMPVSVRLLWADSSHFFN